MIGPLGDSKEDMIGSWAAAGDRKTRPVTLLEGLRARAGKSVNITYARGAGYRFDEAGKTDGFAEAIALAQKSDVIVAAMGERWDMTGEAASRTSLDLPGAQQALLKELQEDRQADRAGADERPAQLDRMGSRAMSMRSCTPGIPGTMGGHAVADVLFGDYNPSGKLPVTFPRNVGQVPIYYNMKNTGRPYTADKQGQKYLSRYLNTPNTPLYPFGHGLSYTSFSYSPVTLDRATHRAGPDADRVGHRPQHRQARDGDGDRAALCPRPGRIGDAPGEGA